MRDLAYIAASWAAPSAGNLWLFATLSGVFAVFGRFVRGVTTGGALAGALVCFSLLLAAGTGGFVALLTVFILTWACTRFGYAKKQRIGTAEARTGRDPLQVFANLGIATGCSVGFVITGKVEWLIAMAAALSEAAADTVSSEIGQTVGVAPRLVTNWMKVDAGTNGAITLVGTMAGAGAAVVVGAVSALTGLLDWQFLPICVGAGLVGMIADSFLGATLERQAVLGNNGVNFVSTAVAAVVGFLLSR